MEGGGPPAGAPPPPWWPPRGRPWEVVAPAGTPPPPRPPAPSPPRRPGAGGGSGAEGSKRPAGAAAPLAPGQVGGGLRCLPLLRSLPSRPAWLGRGGMAASAGSKQSLRCPWLGVLGGAARRVRRPPRVGAPRLP